MIDGRKGGEGRGEIDGALASVGNGGVGIEKGGGGE